MLTKKKNGVAIAGYTMPEFVSGVERPPIVVVEKKKQDTGVSLKRPEPVDITPCAKISASNPICFNANINQLFIITSPEAIAALLQKSVLILFARHKILKCSSPPNAIDSSSLFSVNRAFTSKRLKLNLTGSPGAANKAAAAAAKKATGQKPQGTPAGYEDQQTPGGTTTTTTTTTPTPGGLPDEDGFTAGMTEEEMRENRKFVVQSVIVRIMKARKTITHNNLISETISQVSSRFNPNVPMIKACIEGLIEQQYMARDMKDSDTYHYIA